MSYSRSDAPLVRPGMIRDINREWESVCRLGERKSYPAGHEIRFEGEHFDDFFYLSSGQITSFYRKDDGAINIAIFYERGVLLNEKVSILGFCESPTRYICETAITGFQFPARLLNDPLFRQRHPNLIYSMLAGQALKNVTLERMRSAMFGRTALQRLCWYVLELSKLHHGRDEFSPDLTQASVARLLGIHKSSMARCMAHLKLHGIVSQFTKTRLRIEDRERLRELSLTHAAPASLAF